MTPADQVRKIGTITSIEELNAFEAEARTRGLLPEEVTAIAERRRALERNEPRPRRSGAT